jgi:hypothetical protein
MNYRFVCLLEIHYFVSLAFVFAESTNTVYRHIGPCGSIITLYRYIVLSVCFGYVICTQMHVCVCHKYTISLRRPICIL